MAETVSEVYQELELGLKKNITHTYNEPTLSGSSARDPESLDFKDNECNF